MKTRTAFVNHCLVMTFLSLTVINVGNCQVVFEDDFNNGNADTPVKWTPREIPFTEYDASSGDYIFRALPSYDASDDNALYSGPEDFVLEDTSVVSQVRGVNPFRDMGIGARWNEAEKTGYWNAIFGNGTVYIGRNDGPGNIVILASGDIPWDVVDQDVLLRFDAIGTTLKTWMWLPGTPMPQEPLLTAEDTLYQTGVPGIYAIPEPGGEAIYRFVNASVPEPSTAALTAMAVLCLLASARRSCGNSHPANLPLP